MNCKPIKTDCTSDAKKSTEKNDTPRKLSILSLTKSSRASLSFKKSPKTPENDTETSKPLSKKKKPSTSNWMLKFNCTKSKSFKKSKSFLSDSARYNVSKSEEMDNIVQKHDENDAIDESFNFLSLNENGENTKESAVCESNDANRNKSPSELDENASGCDVNNLKDPANFDDCDQYNYNVPANVSSFLDEPYNSIVGQQVLRLLESYRSSYADDTQIENVQDLISKCEQERKDVLNNADVASNSQICNLGNSSTNYGQASTSLAYQGDGRWTGEECRLGVNCSEMFCPTHLNVESIKKLLRSITFDHTKCHTRIDYIHFLVPDLKQISSCSFYWGKMDRYEAERLLEGKPEGTFILRDSAQNEFLFSVSFRKYDLSLHARIEQWNHKFSFDSHDPGVYSSNSVCGLIEHYKDPAFCMFFEPILTTPLIRNFVFPLQHLCRATITSCLQYDAIEALRLPTLLKNYLREYHYRQCVRVKRFDGGEPSYVELTL